ncbi:NADPH-dependent F420 reductase [Chryseolinea lacunae]|uniref:NAD(P)-binding domain-containing protein n=1 Tax=Chryseolinea lacunae TaxID=2801331 RepID=A0ABS1KZ80_9BACT|nr:NAD(P)-binding domain-containing protein [Chryseolinea lacunae]MBL0744694.1 NAD(P)-binding domain-containing protein [Chryseolinea lacunae]
MSTNKSKVAVIGLGNIGKVVASNLAKGKREVIVASHRREDAEAIAKELGSLVRATDVASAIQEADIVVMAVWFSTIQELFAQYATELQGKIVVDPSNPIAPDGNGGFKKIIGAQESAGQILAGLLPKGTKLVKALGSLGAASLSAAAHKRPANVLFYATDHSDVSATIEELVVDSGFEPVRLGGIDQSIRMEVFGELHEFGALGKPVTKAELKQAV